MCAVRCRAGRQADGRTAAAGHWRSGRLLSVNEAVAEALAARIDTPNVSPMAHGLSPREFEVLRLLVEGHTNRGIADTLSLSPRTVENHVLHIFTKLGVESRTAAVTLAFRNGWMSPQGQ